MDLLLKTLVLLVGAGADLRARATDRLTSRHEPQAGIGALEAVVLGLGLFLLAGIVVAVITTATNDRLDLIK